MIVTAISGGPNWWISYLQTSIYVSPLRKRGRYIERVGGTLGGRTERKEGGKASKVRARARSLKPQRPAAAAAAFLEGRPEDLYHGAHSSPLPPSLSLYRPGLSSSARCFPSPAGQKDELLAKEVGLQCSTWSECTMLEFVKLYFGNFAALSLVKTSHSGHYNLNQPTCCASLCLLLVCTWKALTIFAVSSLYS